MRPDRFSVGASQHRTPPKSTASRAGAAQHCGSNQAGHPDHRPLRRRIRVSSEKETHHDSRKDRRIKIAKAQILIREAGLAGIPLNHAYFGDGGNDLMMGGNGADHFFAGSGVNTVAYVNATSGVSAALDPNELVPHNTGFAAGSAPPRADGAAFLSGWPNPGACVGQH